MDINLSLININLTTCIFYLSVIFCLVGDTPNYRCALPPNATLNESIPQKVTEDGSVEYEKCSMYANPGVDNSTVPCQYGYWYDPASGYESTLTTEVIQN